MKITVENAAIYRAATARERSPNSGFLQLVKCCLAALALAAGAFGQTPEPKPSPFPDVDIQAFQAQAEALSKQVADLGNLKDLTNLATKIRIDPLTIDVQPYLANVDRELANVDRHLALLQKRGRDSDSSDHEYDAGTRALDGRRYDEAISRFDRVIESKGSRADGALYWRAYALNRLGRRDDALASLATLRQQYPNSPWVKDGQALEVEVRQSNGRPVSPTQEANDDLKLMAISGVMNADPDRAIPLLDGVLKSASSPQVKDRAMFVLTQNKSSQARAVLVQLAKGGGNPDLQERAIRYIGMTGTPESRQELAGIYASTSDVNVKKAVLRSLMSSSSTDTLFDIAKNEKNPELRRMALRQLAFQGNSAQAAQLYASEQSPENKDEIINGLFARGDAKTMVDLARKETDPERKKFIVSRLANMHSKDATDYLMELLK